MAEYRLRPGKTTNTGCTFPPGATLSRTKTTGVYSCNVDNLDGFGDVIPAGQRYWCINPGDLEEIVPPTHASLERVFALAVAQSRDGKGADRHGNGKPFEEQPIVRDIAELGSNHGAIAQVRKKALESTRLAATGRKDMAMAELLGAMVYAGAAYLILERDAEV